MKPPFTYFGGKCRIAPRIAALLPPHEHYVEPFGGSLAVLLAKPRSHMETVNDLDQSVMSFWRVLRERPDDLTRACALTPHSRAEHQLAYEPCDDDLEAARRLWVRLTQARSSQPFKGTGWRYYQDPRGSHSSMPDYLAAYVARLGPVAQRLAGVSLECLPALDIIGRYGRHADCLIYADPPYLESVRRSAGRGPSYGCELRTEEDHRALAEVLRSAAAAVVLSGYHSPLYDDLYDGWDRTEIAGFTGNAATGSAARTEVLWSNRLFPSVQADLFDLAGDAS